LKPVGRWRGVGRRDERIECVEKRKKKSWWDVRRTI
jgi:hypothetical protein